MDTNSETSVPSTISSTPTEIAKNAIWDIVNEAIALDRRSHNLESFMDTRWELSAKVDSVAEEIGKLGTDLAECKTAAKRLDDDYVRVLKENEKLQRFKAYVHKRLDDAGVPHDPEPENNQTHGCRIEGRLNYLIARNTEGKKQ